MMLQKPVMFVSVAQKKQIERSRTVLWPFHVYLLMCCLILLLFQASCCCGLVVLPVSLSGNGPWKKIMNYYHFGCPYMEAPYMHWVLDPIYRKNDLPLLHDQIFFPMDHK
jgi:hypothetical protein